MDHEQDCPACGTPTLGMPLGDDSGEISFSCDACGFEWVDDA